MKGRLFWVTVAPHALPPSLGRLRSVERSQFLEPVFFLSHCLCTRGSHWMQGLGVVFLGGVHSKDQ